MGRKRRLTRFGEPIRVTELSHALSRITKEGSSTTRARGWNPVTDEQSTIGARFVRHAVGCAQYIRPMTLADVTRDGVLAALVEFERLGRREFVRSTGFPPRGSTTSCTTGIFTTRSRLWATPTVSVPGRR